MRTACRGDCTLYAVPKKIGPMYAAGFGWCATCSAWFGLERVSCPCCNQPLRRRARRNVGAAGGRRGDRPPLRRVPLPPAAAVGRGGVRLMSCRGICTRHSVGRPSSGPVYDGGRCRCQRCGVWMSAAVAVAAGGTDAVGNRCPCCGQRVRFGKRGSAMGRVRRPAEAVPAISVEVAPEAVAPKRRMVAPPPEITVRPFYDARRKHTGMPDYNDNDNDNDIDGGIMPPIGAAAGPGRNNMRVPAGTGT